MQAWRAFLRAHAVLTRNLEGDLLREHELPLPSYDVLVQLVESPERKLRMTELADAVMLSRSGLTRLVDRLEREGLVVREACLTDGRGLYAVLTDAGYARLREASGTHLRGIQRWFAARLGSDDVAALQRILGRLLEEPGQPSVLSA
ncbi:MarR family transcriptional regulator [Motilibacter rhizosphaerae]|uniref:MarR family transcriptional regulator n=2 Tax=Motilibacter rhizosphaerae TaxID=598652 RepID=A0A4Q7NPN4_9ACTN|nr:MarR family transcriptional regulator [Motilibacter rhizosphaerae]